MDLATFQRHLRDLIKDRAAPSADADPYLCAVADSSGLKMVREIVLWWRGFGIERSCVLTSALLKRRGRFDEAVRSFVRDQTISPYVEELGRSFLEALGGDSDRLVATVARFELALGDVVRGDPREHGDVWDHDPVAVLGAVARGLPLDEERAPGVYHTVVSRELPGLFQVVEEGRHEGQEQRSTPEVSSVSGPGRFDTPN